MAQKSVETIVREMADREAIRDLPLRYCHHVWKKDVPAIVNLFTEDGEFDAGGAQLAAKGKAELLKAYQQGLSDLDPHPFIHNHVFELHGPDRATGNCYLELRATRDGKAINGAGHYDDEYAKVGDEWKFRSRKFHVYYFGDR
ncbi:MAG: nuclear transport factor 2 family protein [Deltaproteobacteria bacterium]|nr:nuclear transport factor 2 family protein [Deltaproteobacteria bacterium]